jgi:hypothetical protein
MSNELQIMRESLLESKKYKLKRSEYFGIDLQKMNLEGYIYLSRKHEIDAKDLEYDEDDTNTVYMRSKLGPQDQYDMFDYVDEFTYIGTVNDKGKLEMIQEPHTISKTIGG